MTFDRNRMLRKAEAFIGGRLATTATRRPSSSTRQVEIDDTHPELHPAPCIGQSPWVVAMVSPRSDGRAIAALQEAGYAVFSPSLVGWVRKGYKKFRRASPLFPGYVFVGMIPGPRFAVLQCDKIIGVVSDASGPVHVREETVRAISDAMMRGDFDKTVTLDDRMKPGDPVTITAGPFAGMKTSVAAMLDETRVSVLLSILGSERLVAIEASALVPA